MRNNRNENDDKIKQAKEYQEPMMPKMPEMPPMRRRPVMPQPPMPPMPRMPMMPPCIYMPGGGMPPTTMPPVMPRDPYVDFEIEPGPPVMKDTAYLQGYLKSIIGKYIKVNFILGTNMYLDKEGTLVDVGVDHIVLREPQTDDLIVADLYSIKFVTVYY